MAATCTAAGLITAGNCFTREDIGAKQQKAFVLYLMGTYLIAFGGAQYIGTAGVETNLLNDSACIRNLTQSQRMGALVGILNGGLGANYGWLDTPGTGIATFTKEQLIENTKCLVNWSDDQLDAAILFLLCSIWSAQQSLA